MVCKEGTRHLPRLRLHNDGPMLESRRRILLVGRCRRNHLLPLRPHGPIRRPGDRPLRELWQTQDLAHVQGLHNKVQHL